MSIHHAKKPGMPGMPAPSAPSASPGAAVSPAAAAASAAAAAAIQAALGAKKEETGPTEEEIQAAMADPEFAAALTRITRSLPRLMTDTAMDAAKRALAVMFINNPQAVATLAGAPEPQWRIDAMRRVQERIAARKAAKANGAE